LNTILRPIQGLIHSINKVFRKLEIAVDGVFKPMLLLKKKKYAALKCVNLEAYKAGREKLRFEPEYKGIDMVRRDWSDLSREASEGVLNIILTERNMDDMRTRVGEYLEALAQKLATPSWLPKFIISKQLTKHPK
jgi:DNA polymerase alpha subunit A